MVENIYKSGSSIVEDAQQKLLDSDQSGGGNIHAMLVWITDSEEAMDIGL